MCETCDTFEFTGSSLIVLVTSTPSNIILSEFNSIFIFFMAFFIDSVSSKSIFSFNNFNVTHLYMAPVSRYTRLSFLANSDVTVPFPVPDGPSIATIKDIFLYTPYSYILFIKRIYYIR